jgi:hypothetical protein
MLEILEKYTEWSKMEINVEKCATASYVCDEDKRPTYMDNNFRFRGEEIPNLTTAESTRYLGAPIPARRTAKLKTVKFKLDETNILLGKIMSSLLLTVQKINAVKTFLRPSIDFRLSNREPGGTQLSTMDKTIRRAINDHTRIKGLPIECHYPSWRDGGASYTSLKDRGDVRAIRAFAEMTLTEDEGLRSAMRQFIENER